MITCPSFARFREPVWHYCLLLLLASVFASTSVSAGTPEKPILSYAVYSDKSAEIFWEKSTDDLLVIAYEITLNGSVVATIDARSYYNNSYIEGESYDFSVTAINVEGDRSAPALLSFIGGDRRPPGPVDPVDPVDPPNIGKPSAPANLR